MDLINMSDAKMVHFNNGMTYSLNVIDLYSKKAWAVPIKTKAAEEIVRGLREIFEKDGPPSILQSDNGSEFKNQVLDTFLKSRNVKSIHSLAYKPTSQGAIERWNQTLKHLIYQHFTQFNTKKWVDVLPSLVENYNTSIHSTTSQRPNKLHQETQQKVIQKVAAGIRDKALRQVESTKKKFTDLKKGDWVRVHVGHGNAFKKSFKSQWSKSIYKVVSRSKPKNPLLQPTYAIETKDGVKISNRFGRGELLKVPDPETFSENPATRPDFSNGDIFNWEQHLRNIQQQKKPAAPKQMAAKPVASRTRKSLLTASVRKDIVDNFKPTEAEKQLINAVIQKETPLTNTELAKKYGLQDFSVVLPEIPKKVSIPQKNAVAAKQLTNAELAKKYGLQDFSIVVPKMQRKK